MRQLHLYIVAVLLSLSSHAALADEGYIGIGLGQSKVNVDAVFTLSKDETGNVWKVYGGLNVNPNIIVEAGIIDFGDFGAKQAFTDGTYDYYGAVTAAARSLYIAGVGRIPLGSAVDLFAKVGVHRWSLAVASSYNIYNRGTNTFVRNISTDENDHGVKPMFGAGVDVKLADHLSLRAEWERYQDIGNDNIGKSNADVWTVGGQFRF